MERITPGLYSGTITEASDTEPALDPFYTVAINLPGGQASFASVRPQKSARISSAFPDQELNLIPFKVGHKVVVHVDGSDSNLTAVLDRGENAEYGECEAADG